MKKTALFLLAMSAVTSGVYAQSVTDLLNKVRKSGSTPVTTTTTSGGTGQSVSSRLLGNGEISDGLREALKLGAQTATKNLSATNGFFANPLIKILMPPEVKNIESKMRQLGFNNLMDKAILSMNRAAEDASAQALPILVNAITSFTIQDGLEVLNGGDNAATNLLRSRTTPQITAAFRPVISRSMSKYNVEQIWSEVFKSYNSLPIIKNKVNTDLTGYITDRALSGLFLTIGQEEKKIRMDPVATGSAIITRVFGSKK